jgi:membrane protease YdiL (CAAX protease family)
MVFSAFFLNDSGRLRSGWRLILFVGAFIAIYLLLASVVRILFVIEEALQIGSNPYLENIIFRLVFLGSAVLAGWLCNYWLEGLPWRALGLSSHSGWWRDLLFGSIIGAASLTIAVLIALAGGGLRFSFLPGATVFPMARALLSTGILFIVAALAEEATFRGYPLQTLTRARLLWFGVLLTSVPFAIIHWQNPGATIFSTLNTALAGVWLAAAYLRTRSLWFPLGVHWAWNWAQGSIFGLAVSGLNLSRHTVLRAVDQGPAWLTGGHYGIEGGVACTIAVLVSTLFIWRTPLLSATPELNELTSAENPVRHRSPQILAADVLPDDVMSEKL